MELLPEEIAKTIPKLYETEDVPLDKKQMLVRFVAVQSSWEWYATEFDPIEKLFFGYVMGVENEWGYFSIQEFEEVNNSGIKIIRDVNFEPITFKELKEQI